MVSVQELIHSLENAGEVGVSIAMHDIDGNKVTRSKPCCFVLDPPKEKTLQKKATFFARFPYYSFIKFKVFPKNPPMFVFKSLLAGGLRSDVWSPSQHGESAVLYQHQTLLEGQVAGTENNPMMSN